MGRYARDQEVYVGSEAGTITKLGPKWGEVTIPGRPRVVKFDSSNGKVTGRNGVVPYVKSIEEHERDSRLSSIRTRFSDYGLSTHMNSPVTTADMEAICDLLDQRYGDASEC
jgi:hypothetical protein